MEIFAMITVSGFIAQLSVPIVTPEGLLLRGSGNFPL